MGATYTRQSASAIVDGGVIEASDLNAEFNQILAAFAVTSGHTHDGTAAEGGPITKLLGTAITIGDATAGTDIAVTFDGESADGVLTWMEDEDYFKFSDDILMNSTERLNFGDTGTYIFQSTDGQLDIIADTEVQIAATTIDINGAVDISGALTLAGTTLAETISDTVGAMVTSNTESGITVAYNDADNTLDFTVGTLNQDTTGNAATATILETARTIGGTSFNGSANIAVALSATATALATARTIHGVSFDGTANIDLSEVISDTVGAMVSSNTESGITVAYDDADNTLDFTVGTLNQDTTGNAATATALETARTIGGTSFDGSANIAVALAATSTALATARTIAGQSFDGSANIAIASTNLSNTSNITLNDGTQTLTNKTLTSPKINEDVAVTSTATELNLLDGKTDANLAIPGKFGGTNFSGGILIGHTTTGTLSSASNNIGIGIGSLDSISTGDNNLCSGATAGTGITGGSHNVAYGTYALQTNSTGGNNTAIGGISQISGTGSSNTSIGYGSLQSVQGNQNIGIGRDAGDNITTGDGNVIIGSINADSATADKQLIVADGVDGSVAWLKGDANGQVKLISGYVLEVALTDAATITWNAATQPVAKVTLGASRTMGLPANPVSGQFISLLIIQDGTGSRTITWNAAYEFAADTAPTLTATANLGDLFTFRYNGAKWLEVGRNLALTLS